MQFKLFKFGFGRDPLTLWKKKFQTEQIFSSNGFPDDQGGI